MDMVYTDEGGVEQGILTAYELDLAYGDEGNDFELTLPYGSHIPAKAYVYADGTAWGGIVRGNRVSTMADPPVSVVTGRTWQGMLSESYVCPDAGKSHFEVDAEANAAIGAVVARQGMGGVFDVSESDTGVRIACRFDRFADAYSGLRKMLAGAGMRLDVAKPPGRKPVLSAVPARTELVEGSSSPVAYELSCDTPYNHMILLGAGEMEEREVVHLYADRAGSVSRTQTLFGADERQYLYELSNESGAELLDSGTKKLAELQKAGSCELGLPEGMALEVGDSWMVRDDEAGLQAEAEVVAVVVEAGDEGVMVTNEIGDVRYSKGGSRWL